MHGESDIFCLKKSERGDDDGNQMFSVGGSRSIRLNRRKQTDSNVFPSGCMGNSEDNTEEILSSRKSSESKEATAHSVEVQNVFDNKAATEKKNDIEDAPAKSTLYEWKRNPLTGEGVEIEAHRQHKGGSQKKFGKWVW